MRVGYVASKSRNATYALDENNVIAACFAGPDPYTDACSYAKDYVKAEEKTAYVYAVSIEPRHKFEIKKEVVGSAHTQ